MLGKGLESLIPPQQGGDGGNPQAQQPAPNDGSTDHFTPTQESAQPARQALPAQLEPSHQEPAEPAEPEPARPEQVLYPAPKEIPRESARPGPQFTAQPLSPKPQRREEPAQQSIYQIEIEKISPNPGQPRRDFNEGAIKDLAASIREFGFIQPLVVTKIEKETPTGIDVEYQLIAGERRLLAAKMLGLRVAPAIIRNVALEREKLELAVIENIQRENLNPIEIARSFQRLQEEFHLTQREIASKLGKSREVVANSVRLLDLPPYIQEALQKGELSESHGRLLLSVADPAAQKKLFDDIAMLHLTTRDVKERVKRMADPNAVREADEDNLAPEVKAMRESLSMSLGAPVEIKKGVNTGKISITFYSEEELENILRRLGEREV